MDVSDTVINERNEDVQIFYQLFVNIDDPNTVALMKDVVLDENDTAIFEQNKFKIHAEGFNIVLL